MTPVDRVRELVERWQQQAASWHGDGATATAKRSALTICANDLAALLPLLEQQEARMGEYERALRGLLDEDDAVSRDRARRLLESLTHKKVDGEGA